MQNRVDLSLLVITKGLTKKISDGKEDNDDNRGSNEQGKGKETLGANKNATYNSNLAHVKLAEKMKQRDAASAPNVGDRVAYVVVKGTKGSKAYEKSEDPIYALENNLPIDTTYYIEN